MRAIARFLVATGACGLFLRLFGELLSLRAVSMLDFPLHFEAALLILTQVLERLGLGDGRIRPAFNVFFHTLEIVSCDTAACPSANRNYSGSSRIKRL